MNKTNTQENKYKSKTYECKNFAYPYIQINNYDNGTKYSLNFLNENKTPIKIEEYEENIPNCLLKLFNMKINQINKGIITEIKCINSISI